MGEIDISAFVRRPLRDMAIRDTTLEKHQLNTLPSKALNLAVSKLDVVDPSIVLRFLHRLLFFRERFSDHLESSQIVSDGLDVSRKIRAGNSW